MAVDGYALNKTGQQVDNILENAMLKGVSYVTAGQLSGATRGAKATVEGKDNTASGNYSHAEGSGNTASGVCSHTEGDNVVASGYTAHAEGLNNQANGQASHVEGNYNRANGSFSHAEGQGTIANGTSQNAKGKYNIADNSNTYAEIVGNGTGDSSRSNARTLDWSGNETLAGKLTLGADPVNNMDATTKQYVESAIQNGIINSMITDTVSGNPIEITDGADNIPLKSALLKGKTVAINQLVGNSYAPRGATTIVVDANNYFTLSDPSWTSGTRGIKFNIPTLTAHKYYARVDCTAKSNMGDPSFIYRDGSDANKGTLLYVSGVETKESITSPSADSQTISAYFTPTSAANSITFRFMLIDLTLCGFTSEETADVATLKAAWLAKYGVPLPQCIPYNAGSIVSNNAVYQLSGHNIWNEQWEIGDYDDTTGQPTTYNNKIRSKSTSPIPVKPNTAYCLYAGVSRISVVYWYDANDAFISRAANADAIGTVTSPDNACYMRFKCADGYGTTYNNNLAVNYPATVTTYEPFHDGGSIVADSLNGIGTVQDEQDESGAITRRFAAVDMGSLNWASQSTPLQKSFYSEVLTNVKAPTLNVLVALYGTIDADNFVNRGDKVVAISSSGRINVNDNAYSDAATFKTAMDGVYLVYELATPTTDTTTAATLTTQKGYNILRTVSGDIQSADATLEYRADTALYIQKIING